MKFNHEPKSKSFLQGRIPKIPIYVKKPECPARKSGDEWPKGLLHLNAASSVA
jgi:hypothetical protein